ncbi:MAG: translation initiation factor IF-3 [Deltaproteobacteria bacterium]|jgi:translation initiation factor IF-3|nr:translation initiation factor IF-3 [Deltaproteobacteria bacterium]
MQESSNTRSNRPIRTQNSSYNKDSNNKKNSNAERHIVNRDITAREVRVIGTDGEQLGILKTVDALKIASDANLDLVVVAAQADPPVCKIIDLGKLKYKEQKKAAEIRKKSAVQETKELRIRYNTDVHDLETKIKNALKFLGEGDKARFSMRFKGREAMYANLGNELFDQIITRLEEFAQVDERTKLIGQKMLLTFAPKHMSKKK